MIKDILAVIGALDIICALALSAVYLACRPRRNDPARAAAMARHPAGGRQTHLSLVRGDAA